MQLETELTLLEMLRVLFRNSLKILACGMIAGAAGFGLSQTRPTYFALEALIRVADLGPMGEKQVKATQAYTEPSSLRKEAISYLTFKFLSKKPAPGEAAFLKEVDEERGTDLIYIKVHGYSIEATQKYADSIMKELQAKFASQVQDVIEDAKLNLKLYESQIAELKNGIEFINKSIAEIGFSTVLVQQRNDMQNNLIRANALYLQYRSSLSIEKTHNFYFHEAHPVDSLPVTPKPLVWGILGALLGIGAFSFYLFLREDDLRLQARMRQSQQARAIATSSRPLKAVASASAPGAQEPSRMIPRTSVRR